MIANGRVREGLTGVCCIRDQRRMISKFLGLYGQVNKRIRWMPRR